MPLIHHLNLRDAIQAIVAQAGSSDEEARLVADNLVGANLAGHDSHGVGMIPRYMESARAGMVTLNAHAEVVTDHGNMLVIDGRSGYGQVIGREVMTLGIARAREHGVAVVATRNSFHLARIGAWAELCAEAGLVSMHHVNVMGHGASVAPFGGSDGRLVTNPYCAAMPATAQNPATLLDFATSFIAIGKLRVARNKGELAPEGALIDHQGQPTRDPNVVWDEPRGSLLPFGGHKGYGLALINELFAGVLSGGQCCRPETDRPGPAIINNMLSVIIDPGRLIGREFFERETDTALAWVKASPPLKAGAPVLAPGDPERASRARRTAEGVPVDEQTWRDIRAAAVLVGLDVAILDQIAGLPAAAAP